MEVKMGPKTRHDLHGSYTTLVDATGPVEAIPRSELPRMRVVLRHGIYLQDKLLLEEEIDRRNFSIQQMVKEIRMKVVICWQRANSRLSLITDKSVEKKILVTLTALENFAWNRGGMKKEEDRKSFLDRLDHLFNIASCGHNILPCTEAGCEGCQEGAHLADCNCKKEKKIPKLELAFMMSMKALRPPGQKATMMIAGVDSEEHKTVKNKEKKELVEKKAAEMVKKKQLDMDERRGTEAELLLQEQEGNTEEAKAEGALKKKNTMKKRTEASNRQAAAITSGFLQDLIDAKVLPAGMEYLDPNKIHRSREEVMTKVKAKKESEMQEGDIRAILIDSRITQTKVREFNPVTRKFYTSTKKLDLYTMTDGDGHFLQHFVK
jgi:hypothetical protein